MTGVDGRVAIVGGSSSGLGYAVAELLARSGARVSRTSRGIRFGALSKNERRL